MPAARESCSAAQLTIVLPKPPCDVVGRPDVVRGARDKDVDVPFFCHAAGFSNSTRSFKKFYNKFYALRYALKSILYFCRKRPMPRITATRDLRALRVFINELLHLEVLMEGYAGLQAWQEGSRRCVYKIEFYRDKGKRIVCEYEERDVWEGVLKVVQEKL